MGFYPSDQQSNLLVKSDFEVLSQSFLERNNSRVLDKFMRPSWQTV